MFSSCTMIKIKKELYFFPVWIKVLSQIYIYNIKGKAIYKTQISKSLDITYSHIVQILLVLEDRELIQTEKQGRNQYIKLTEKGLIKSKICFQLLQ